MNSHPNSHTTAISNLTHTHSHLSTKETAMNSRIATVRIATHRIATHRIATHRIATILVALFVTLVLSACAVPSPFQQTGSVTLLPKEAAAPNANGVQVSDRQQLADYQASLGSLSVAPTTTGRSNSTDTQISSRQWLAEYQASLPVSTADSATARTARYTGIQQIYDRQALADYQATLR